MVSCFFACFFCKDRKVNACFFSHPFAAGRGFGSVALLIALLMLATYTENQSRKLNNQPTQFVIKTGLRIGICILTLSIIYTVLRNFPDLFDIDEPRLWTASVFVGCLVLVLVNLVAPIVIIYRNENLKTLAEKVLQRIIPVIYIPSFVPNGIHDVV